MSDVLTIVSLVISFLSFVLVVIIFIFLVLKKKNPAEDSKSSEYFGEIKASLQNEQSAMPLVISEQVAKQMVGIQKQLSDQAETNNKKLTDFQIKLSGAVGDSFTQMNTSLNARVDAMSTSLTKSVTALNDKVDKNLLDINKQVGDTLTAGFKGNSDTMGELKEKLGKIDEAQKHLESLQSEVVSLNNVLSSNQARGRYGELQLEMLLEATFPHGKGKFYNLQDDLGRVKDGEKVRPDADIVFKVDDMTTKLCIDSKFPLTDYAKLFSGDAMTEEDKRTLRLSFRSAIKTQIDSIASKYIIPEVTMKYAIMFVPNDGVFAYIENEFSDLVSFARGEGVIVACPSTLQAIIVVFHSAALDAERNKDLAVIDTALKTLGTEFDRFSKRWDDLEKSIDTVTKRSKDFSTTVGKISTKFTKISQNELSTLSTDDDKEVPAIEAPKENNE